MIERGQPHYSQTDVDTYYNKGYIWMEKGKYNRAIDDFTMALLIDPCCAKAYYQRGRALSIKGNLDLALNDAKEAQNLKPDRQEYIQFAKIAKALGHPARIAILKFLAKQNVAFTIKPER